MKNTTYRKISSYQLNSRNFYPKENVKQGLLLNNSEILNFDETTVTQHGLLLTPKSKRHIYNEHINTNSSFKFDKSISVVNLIDDAMNSIVHHTNDAYAFCEFEDMCQYTNEVDKVKIVYNSKTPIAKISNDDNFYTVIVVNPYTNEIITVSPCSKNRYTTGQRISKLTNIQVSPIKNFNSNSHTIQKIFSLDLPSKLKYYKSKEGLILNTFQLCSASLSYSKSKYPSYSSQKKKATVNRLEFSNEINVSELGDEVFCNYKNNAPNITSNFSYKNMNDAYWYDEIVIGYNRSRELPCISSTNDYCAILKFKCEGETKTVVEFRPCSEKEYCELKNKFSKKYNNQKQFDNNCSLPFAFKGSIF